MPNEKTDLIAPGIRLLNQYIFPRLLMYGILITSIMIHSMVSARRSTP